MLSIDLFRGFFAQYKYENRSITEQTLNLDSTQRSQLFNFLETNNLPENRFYKYDFFFDNCATRIRDAVNQVFEGKLEWKDHTGGVQKTFRNLIDERLIPQPWSKFGIDLALGATVTDRIAKPWEYQFLPEEMNLAFGKAVFIENGTETPLVIETNVILPRNESLIAKNSPFTPLPVTAVIFILIAGLTLLAEKRKKALKGLDFGLFFILGWVGWLYIFLWFFSDHVATAGNWNLLWCFPLNMPLILFLWKKKTPGWLRYYWLLITCMAVMVACFGWLLPQAFNLAFYPLAAIVAIRAGLLFRRSSIILQQA